LLFAEKEKDQIDDHVGLLQRFDGLRIGREPGLANRPSAVSGERGGKTHVIHTSSQTLAGGKESIGIV
jgi:hypothetical protein